MEQYSRQFIEELAKHIDPAIADFFNMKHEIFKFPFMKSEFFSPPP